MQENHIVEEYDIQNEKQANALARILLYCLGGVYILLFILTLANTLDFDLWQILPSCITMTVASVVCLFASRLLYKEHLFAIKYFLVITLLFGLMMIEGSTATNALFISIPVLVACRYHNKRFLWLIIGLSFCSVFLKEVYDYFCNILNLNVVNFIIGSLIPVVDDNVVHTLQPYINYNSYISDVLFYSILPNSIQLLIICICSILLENNSFELNKREKDSIIKDTILENEFSIANSIQMGLLPHDFNVGSQVDICAGSLPAKNVGGDFYDFFYLDSNHLAMVMADVSGKGMAAALFMATTKMSIRDYAKVGLSVEDAFTHVNQSISQGNSNGMFVTAWLGILDTRNGRLNFVNAGHNPPLIKRRDGSYEYLKMRKNLILGAYEDYRYKRESLVLEEGDRLFLYTDGVTEARKNNEILYGEERLQKFLSEASFASAEETVNGIYGEIKSFQDRGEQYDDITVLSLEYKGNPHKTFERSFPASLDSYNEVIGFIEERTKAAGLDSKKVRHLLVATDEIFSNIVNYSYVNKDGSVGIIISEQADRVEISFSDGGIRFNPLQKKDADLTAPLEKRKIGGLGITLVRRMVDDIRYSYVENQNILTLTVLY